jgi:hypothetical protein
MTEAEWLNGADLEGMLGVVRTRGTDRQFRHLMTAFVAGLVSLVDGAPSRKLIQLLDRFAAGAISRSDLHREWSRKAYKNIFFDTYGDPWSDGSNGRTLADNVEEACFWVLSCLIPELPIYNDQRKWIEIQSHALEPSVSEWITRLIGIIREVMGNPFHPDGRDDS